MDYLLFLKIIGYFGFTYGIIFLISSMMNYYFYELSPNWELRKSILRIKGKRIVSYRFKNAFFYIIVFGALLISLY